MKGRVGDEGFLQRALLIGALLSVLATGCAMGSNEGALNERHAKAQAMFEQRCKTAGEKIYRQVEDVEGIYLLKIRPEEINYGDQFKMDDPYGHDSGGDNYILNFLRGFYHQRADQPAVAGAPPQVGYLYVEAVDKGDGKRYRYTASLKDVVHTESVLMGGDGRTKFVTRDFALEKMPAPGPAPRYGVTYDDISTHEEREYWIAGSSLKVIDLQTNEVIGERIGYMMDAAQGSLAGARAPWLFAANHACPGFQRNPLIPVNRSNGGGASEQAGQTLFFVEKILKPKVEARPFVGQAQ